MPSIIIWTPESDFDSKTVLCIAQKIIDYYKYETDLIIEPEPGGKGAKEYLIKFSQEIIKEDNPNLQGKDIKQKQYEEKQSPEIAKHIQIDKNTMTRNESLQEFANSLKEINERK